jgi:hypothetical protein
MTSLSNVRRYHKRPFYPMRSIPGYYTIALLRREDQGIIIEHVPGMSDTGGFIYGRRHASHVGLE